MTQPSVSVTIRARTGRRPTIGAAGEPPTTLLRRASTVTSIKSSGVHDKMSHNAAKVIKLGLSLAGTEEI